MSKIRRCKGCTRLFQPADRKQRYHSLRCGNRARQRKRQAKIRKALGKGRECKRCEVWYCDCTPCDCTFVDDRPTPEAEK